MNSWIPQLELRVLLVHLYRWTIRCNMASQSLRSFTYLILLLVTFTLTSWSLLFPNISSDIEPALTGATLSIASGSPNANTPFECYPLSSSRSSFLDKSHCRLAILDFSRRFPRITSSGATILYSLTHSKWHQPLFPIKCPCVIAYSGCVFTLDYVKAGGGDVDNIHTDLLEFWGTKVARACVGKAPEQKLDGGEATWLFGGSYIRLALAWTRMPLAHGDGNLSSVGNGSSAVVSSTESDLAVDPDTNGALEMSDSR